MGDKGGELRKEGGLVEGRGPMWGRGVGDKRRG